MPMLTETAIPRMPTSHPLAPGSTAALASRYRAIQIIAANDPRIIHDNPTTLSARDQEVSPGMPPDPSFEW